MDKQKLVENEINLKEDSELKKEKPFLPYGGKPFSKKTGIKDFDAIIENGYTISSKSIWQNSLKNYKKIFWKTILYFILSGLSQLIPSAIVGICDNRYYRSMSDLNIFYVYFLSNLAIMPFLVKLLYGNVLKVLDEERFLNIKLKYLRMVKAVSLVSVINLFLMLLVMSSIFNINEINEDIIEDIIYGYFDININFINLIIFGVLFIYFYFSFSFTIPLILEYDYTVFESMQISRKMVTRNFSSVFFNFIISFLISFSGLIVFRFGVILTTPLGLLYFCNLYLVIFKKDNEILKVIL